MVHAAEGTLQAYLDGEIDSAAERALREHVGACSSCAAELETLRHAGGLVQQSLAIIDTPVPLLRARAAVARHQRGGTRRMARIGAWGLAKAAMLLLVLAAAGAAAIPDMRRAIETTFSRVVAMFGGGTGQTATVPTRPETIEPAAPVIVPGESFVTPANGRLEILLHTPQAGRLEVVVQLVDEAQAHVRTETTATASRRVGSGSLELRDLGAGTITIGIPRAAREATVEVDGEVHVYKEGGILHGPDAATRGSEVRFIVGS
jgi:anti-sigma factor RsiW